MRRKCMDPPRNEGESQNQQESWNANGMELNWEKKSLSEEGSNFGKNS